MKFILNIQEKKICKFQEKKLRQKIYIYEQPHKMLCHALQGIKTCFDVYGLKMSENTPNVEIIKYYCNITN